MSCDRHYFGRPLKRRLQPVPPVFSGEDQDAPRLNGTEERRKSPPVPCSDQASSSPRLDKTDDNMPNFVCCQFNNAKIARIGGWPGAAASAPRFPAGP